MHTGLNILLKPSVAGEKRQQYLDVVASEVQRLITVTERMLSFHRPSDNVPMPTDVNGLVADVLELAEETLQRTNVSVETDLSEDLPLLELVSDQFRQVFLSIVLNVIDAMPGGGQLAISTTLVPANGMDGHSEEGVSLVDVGEGWSQRCWRAFSTPITLPSSGKVDGGWPSAMALWSSMAAGLRYRTRPRWGAPLPSALQ